MHEMAVVTSIIDAVCEHATALGATRVVALTLHVGAARDIHEPLLQRYFDYFSRGTMAEGVKVTMVTIPLRYRCAHCGRVYDYDLSANAEPACEQHPDAPVALVSGTELSIEDIGVV